MILLSLLVLFIIYHFWVVHHKNQIIKKKRYQNMLLKSENEKLKWDNALLISKN